MAAKKSAKNTVKKPAKTAAKKTAKRKMPAFTKPTEKTVRAFETATNGLSGVERRTMFGYPSVFLNGNMLSCIFQDRIMVRLSPADRELLFLRFVAERTHGEIGAILGCNAHASKMRVSRAARRLRHELDM